MNAEPIVEIQYGDRTWTVYDDGSQQGFPTGAIITVFKHKRNPVVLEGAKAANDYFYRHGRVR